MIRQYDIVRNPDSTLSGKVPFLVVLQSHLLRPLATVIVAPLIRTDLVQPDGAISLAVHYEGQDFTLDMGLLAHIEGRRLKAAVGSARELDYEIQRALDRLFTGF